jgi:TonB-linked SusC/RagA family outer membrane protein
MKKRLLFVLTSLVFVAAQVFAQQQTVTGKVTSEQGTPLSGVTVTVKGTNTRAATNDNGTFTIQAQPGQTLQFRILGKAPEERVVSSNGVVNLQLRTVATNLDAVVVTALGQSTAQRALGTAQQTVSGKAVAEAQRENFVTALQGRVAGVDVVSSSGIPGASASITIRGISSISSSNQPLMIIDGLPMDNRTLNTGVLVSDQNSTQAFSNRGVDFSNRASDLNPEDIESLTVLKGPEASALYGIDAANGAIVITTKRGRPGGGFQYSNSFRIESTRAKYDLQKVYGPTTLNPDGTIGSFQYFGAPYPAGTVFYNNIDNFLQTGATQTHNLSFNGATQDEKINYRLAASSDKQRGVVRNTDYGRINLTAASQAQILSWLNTDASMAYTYDNNDQAYKGNIGPLIGLMLWPQTDNAENYLTPSGVRRRVTTLTTDNEVDNPYYNVDKNKLGAKTNRILSNVGVTLTPFSWGNIKTNIGADVYSNSNNILRDPQSSVGFPYGGMLEQADLLTRNINVQTLFNVNPRHISNSLSISGLLGNAISDAKATTDALQGISFVDPNFVSINNTNTRSNQTTIEQRRLIGAFGEAVVNFRDYLFLTATGRNDWTSTIPKGRNSFFYPSFSTSFIFSDAFPGMQKFMTGKLRAAVASVGKDARPYAFRPALQYKTTSYGGYGYNFWGPNLDLKPEFAHSYEFGTELGFLHDRLGVDATVYRKETKDQIVNDIRGSYGTGFILFNLNGASTRNTGVELTLRGTPVQREAFNWDFNINYAHAKGIVLSLPRALPESYVSDTWLYGNVRNGVQPGLSTMSLTGQFYLRDTVKGSPAYGKLLIDPSTGLPVRSANFISGGYDRQPKYTMGISNTLRYKKATLDFLFDIRRGGDIFNATEHYLTVRGLTMSTLDRNTPRVIPGVLLDGKEGSANPTPNNIVIVPAVQTGYYTNMSEELFIEKNINWIRLRDIQLSYLLPEGFIGSHNASVFVKGTDLGLWTNYTGLDPVVNGNSAAVGGSGGAGIDFGNFPLPRGVNFGIRMGF